MHQHCTGSHCHTFVKFHDVLTNQDAPGPATYTILKVSCLPGYSIAEIAETGRSCAAQVSTLLQSHLQ
jgi:hypothetical protein